VQQDKVKIKLSGVSQTLLLPLWSRAKISRERNSLFYDAKAVELIEKIDYDFSVYDEAIPSYLPLLFVARAKQFDDKIRAYIRAHPRASVVNIGAGLDTTFYRVDNGIIHWYDLDLPAVIYIRKQLLPEPDRVTYIAKSLFDSSWCKDVKHTENGVFMIAGGLLRYFEEAQVRQLFLLLADNLPGGEIVFDVDVESDIGPWIDRFPPEQQGAVRAALMKAMKESWETAPKDERDKLIATLTASVKPKGNEWTDIAAWWHQLSDKEMEEAWHDFRILSNWGLARWVLEDANEITEWDHRITVIDQFPLFKNIPRDSLSEEMRQFMDDSGRSNLLNIIHLRV